MSKFAIIGRQGFLGSALAARLGEVTSYPTPETRVLFHFGSHVHPVFEKNPHFEMERVFHDFTKLLPYCYDHGVTFVYPSSALVYEGDTQFSMFKRTLEQLVRCYKTRTIGLRIFPVYGVGDHGTVISKWCRAMAEGKRPEIYGDGNQSRDFIYIDDVVSQIVSLVNEQRWYSGVYDIGTGVSTSFNDIVRLINESLKTSLEPLYIPAPDSYSKGVKSANPMPVDWPIHRGIHRMALLAKKAAETVYA